MFVDNDSEIFLPELFDIDVSRPSAADNNPSTVGKCILGGLTFSTSRSTILGTSDPLTSTTHM